MVLPAFLQRPESFEMLYFRQLVGFKGALVGAIVIVFAVCDAAHAQIDQDESNSRGVRIIDAPTPPPPAGSPSQVLKSPDVDTANPALLTPAAPSQSVAAPSPAPPAVSVATPQASTGNTKPGSTLLTPALEPPLQTAPTPTTPADVSLPSSPASNNFANVPSNVGVHPTQQDVEALSSGMKVPNAAGLSMQILPGPDITAGSQVSFQVSSKKAGYLILVDVDATGKLVQIYPNPMSLMGPNGVREKSNFIQAGKTLRIPDRGNAYSGFEFVASPPIGTAMVVALLSDRPVQLVDLPDLPGSVAGSASAADYLTKLANELRIPSGGKGATDQLAEAHWSFDVKFYAIR